MFSNKRMTKLSKHIHPDFQDEFFLNLDKILVPVGGNQFECMGFEIAFFIAHEYGAKIDLLHIGTSVPKSIDSYLKKLDKFEIEYNVIVEKHVNVNKSIVDFWKKHHHNLVVMSGRRRPTLIDKIITRSVSTGIIPHIDTEVLQVFPPTIKKISDKLKKIAVLLPYSSRDPFLLRWASAIAAPQKGARIKVYHIAQVPETLPLEGAKNEKVIKREEKIFRDYTKTYADIFGQLITPKFILGHKALSSLEFISGKDEPDLVIIGKSKLNWWQKLTKPLSSKIRDRLLTTGVCIHHMM